MELRKIDFPCDIQSMLIAQVPFCCNVTIKLMCGLGVLTGICICATALQKLRGSADEKS